METFSSYQLNGDVRAKWTRALLSCLAMTVLFMSSPTGQSQDLGDQSNFSSRAYFGIPCVQLAEFSLEELKALLSERNRANFNQFCYPEDYLHCSDYSPLLHDLGYLKHFDDYSCRFLPFTDK